MEIVTQLLFLTATSVSFASHFATSQAMPGFACVRVVVLPSDLVNPLGLPTTRHSCLPALLAMSTRVSRVHCYSFNSQILDF